MLLCGHLGVPVVGFFELHVFPGLAAEVQPLALQPFHGGFSSQGARVHLGYEDDITSCRSQNNKDITHYVERTLYKAVNCPT